MSDLVGTMEDWFSNTVAHIRVIMRLCLCKECSTSDIAKSSNIVLYIFAAVTLKVL